MIYLCAGYFKLATEEALHQTRPNLSFDSAMVCVEWIVCVECGNVYVECYSVWSAIVCVECESVCGV